MESDCPRNEQLHQRVLAGVPQVPPVAINALLDHSVMFRVLDLFSGIGGFSLGLGRTGGFRTVAFCEIEDYPRRVLAKHWPNVPCYGDVRELTAERLRADGIVPDVLCGGFPCQDVSLAGNRAGLGETRSGLWAEFARLIGAIRPRYVIVENTPGLLSLGMGTVLGDLAKLRYDAEWRSLPACYAGADHIRDRVWVVAYPDDGESVTKRRPAEPSQEVEKDASDTMCERLPRGRNARENASDARGIFAWPRLTFGVTPTFPREYREHQPVLGRGVHGVPSRVDRLKGLGNAVVPQIPEMIGRAILAAETTS